MLCKAVLSLDLSEVKMKLMEPAPEGKGWTGEQADEAELWYKRFLQLCLDFPDTAVVPNHHIDTIWHQHILDTRAYARDCQRIFGHFLHHFPYYGLRGDADKRDNSFVETNDLYRTRFGEDCMSMQTFRTSVGQNCSPECGSACEPGPDEAMSCNGKGGGTGCSQKIPPELMATSCGHKGGGTGCSQKHPTI